MLFSPRERDFVPLLHDVLVGVCWQRPHQAEVSDLHRVIGGQQNVAGSQIPVEETLLLQVGHPARHLHTVVTQLLVTFQIFQFFIYFLSSENHVSPSLVILVMCFFMR